MYWNRPSSVWDDGFEICFVRLMVWLSEVWQGDFKVYHFGSIGEGSNILNMLFGYCLASS